MPESFQTIADAVLDAAILCALVLPPGLTWLPVWGPITGPERLGFALALGLSYLVVAATILAESGLFGPTTIGAAVILGSAAGLFSSGHCVCRRDAFRIILLCAAMWFFVMVLPHRGEWIIGGWDPGVNLNQGLLVARTGRVEQPPNPLLAGILKEAPKAFARYHYEFLEVFPGIPADPNTGTIQPYFYRGTPAWIAVLETACGRDAVFRSNFLLAAVAALLLGCLGSATTRLSGPACAGCAGLLLVQPIVVAHFGDPASEMLELAMVCAIGLITVSRGPRSTAFVLFLCVLCGILNRPSFVFHASMWLWISSAWHASNPDRNVFMARHAAIVAAIAGGFAWYEWVVPESLVKIRHWMPAIRSAATAAVVGAIFIEALGFIASRCPNSRLVHILKWFRFLALAPLIAMLVRESFLIEGWREFPGNAKAWLAYAPAVLAFVGALGLVLRGSRMPATPWLIWLASALLAALLRKHAADLHPWACKRWLAWSPPLLAFGASLLWEKVAKSRLPKVVLRVALLLILVAFVAVVPKSAQAWRSAEHLGTMDAVERIARLASPDDLIVSDHFRFGTPLALAYGLNVVSGEPLLAGEGSPELAARALVNTGRRILLLTSTRNGLEAWPAQFQNARLLEGPVRLDSSERVQHRSNRSFSLRKRTYTLRVYEWEPDR
ncbi:MAG: hypothetical protein NZ740_05550 [Kiritimatiellae bacterium]|nr:hypothetical protein [Kiritimatiellia bacterium]MDW8458558.1 hypothetical protein [Verrucomicrobiota bacterium]